MAAKTRPSNSTTWIGAAECAARTGLSARALRVYEQQKLIKPVRDPNGWRQYSSADLSRLNTIAVLKTLGLTLSQIRAQLTACSSSLEGVLRIQMDAWKARKATAEEAIALVQGALNQVELHREVPIDQMCELVRRLEMNSHVPGYRGLIAKHSRRIDGGMYIAVVRRGPTAGPTIRSALRDLLAGRSVDSCAVRVVYRARQPRQR